MKIIITCFAFGLASMLQVRGQMNQIKNNRIEEVIDSMASRKTDLMGYRIQLCFDSDKALVDLNKTKIIGMFPKLETYITFEAPYFNLMVGDFRRKIDAELIKEQVLGKFPLTSIQQTEIRLPRID